MFRQQIPLSVIGFLGTVLVVLSYAYVATATP